MTFLGGGVFGNKDEWICKAIARALYIAYNLSKEKGYDLNIKICHYRKVSEKYKNSIDKSYQILICPTSTSSVKKK